MNLEWVEIAPDNFKARIKQYTIKADKNGDGNVIVSLYREPGPLSWRGRILRRNIDWAVAKRQIEEEFRALGLLK